VSDEVHEPEAADRVPWQQRALDNLWLLVAIAVLVPGILYLLWGLIELALLESWGGGGH
jgi:hypothetical protein